MNYKYEVSGTDFTAAGYASSEIKKILKSLGLPIQTIKRTSIAMYEAEINMVVHGGGGVANVEITDKEIIIVMEDTGPGIPDIEKAMEEGYSTASEKVRELGFGEGMGLPNIKRNSDFMNIESQVGVGTKVTIKILI